MSSLVNQLSSSSVMSEEEEAFIYAWSLRSSGIFPYVLDAAIQLGVFDILAKAGPDAKLSSKHIASEIRAKNPDAPSLLDRMLRLLACYNLVTTGAHNGEDGEKVYGLTLAGKAFVNDENNGSLAAFTTKKILVDVWFHFKDLVLEGGNLFEKAHGMSRYQYNGLNPEHAKSFDTKMTNVAKIIVKKILEKYHGFQGITNLVDVGGGYGVTLNMIISKYPSIKGINYDLPHVVQQAPSFHGFF
ncbi:caffeic acid 3-O-methyltransferase-like isoform X1 [Gossypium australe]|uniref:Caffeic acid 3-O-methyltransferase-like isoform X1 n=1 Tax=Gossypium australe TaxID=47621 RepID=A0A5B6WIH1_9ROSI|nr:caffeic acid 3-O-methyltransferase-like isoform X1 [Gossypium australe]